MIRLLLIVFLLVGCTPVAHDPDPWEEGEVVQPPKGCEDWRKRDPEADC